jgi:hypothetical protein
MGMVVVTGSWRLCGVVPIMIDIEDQEWVK